MRRHWAARFDLRAGHTEDWGMRKIVLFVGSAILAAMPVHAAQSLFDEKCGQAPYAPAVPQAQTLDQKKFRELKGLSRWQGYSLQPAGSLSIIL
jgi:hypothetical protein